MKNTRKPRILITNDDGVNSANIHALARALSPIGEVFVFAPETEQSGVSQAFTIRKSLRVQEHSVPGFACNAGADESALSYHAYSVSGTPADAAKFALGHFAVRHFATKASAEASTEASAIAAESNATLDIHGLPSFDVVFSGINVGENSGVSSLYSGTVAGAREGALWGIPSVSLSLSVGGESLLAKVLDFAKRFVCEKMYQEMPPRTIWNVNFPKSVDGSFKGFKVTKMALGMFTDHYNCTAGEACGSDSSWQLDGEKLWDMEPVDSDDYLLHQGYATITPHRIDQTDEKSFEKLKEVMNKKLMEGGAA